MTLVRRQNNHIFENCWLSSGAKPSKNALKQQAFPHNWPFLACLWGDRNPENFNYVIYPPLFKGHVRNIFTSWAYADAVVSAKPTLTSSFLNVFGLKSLSAGCFTAIPSSYFLSPYRLGTDDRTQTERL